jgi:hypothetical protein
VAKRVTKIATSLLTFGSESNSAHELAQLASQTKNRIYDLVYHNFFENLPVQLFFKLCVLHRHRSNYNNNNNSANSTTISTSMKAANSSRKLPPLWVDHPEAAGK